MVGGIDYESITKYDPFRRGPVISRLALIGVGPAGRCPCRAPTRCLHRPRRRLRGSGIVPRHLHDDRDRDRVDPHLAVPRAVAARCADSEPPRAAIKRLIFVGLDGQDPTLTDRFMKRRAPAELLEAREDGLLPAADDDLSVDLAGCVVVVQHRRPSRRGTTSSTSSIATAAPTCPCCRRRTSARSIASSSSAAT